jgi:hypothetical protein
MWELGTELASPSRYTRLHGIDIRSAGLSLGGLLLKPRTMASWPETDIHEAVAGLQAAKAVRMTAGTGSYSQDTIAPAPGPGMSTSRAGFGPGNFKLDRMTKAHRAPETRGPRRVKELREFGPGVELKSGLCARSRHLKPQMSCRQIPAC